MKGMFNPFHQASESIELPLKTDERMPFTEVAISHKQYDQRSEF